VRTEREIDMKTTLAQKQEQQRQKEEASQPVKAPTLRRPGEAAPDKSNTPGSPLPRDPNAPPGAPPPPIPGNGPPPM
jgi:hypothetical protein